MYRPHYLSSFCNSNNDWSYVEVLDLLTVKLSPFSSYFLTVTVRNALSALLSGTKFQTQTKQQQHTHTHMYKCNNQNERGKARGTYGEMGNAYRIFTEKPEKIRVIGRLVERWNIKMDLKKTDLEGMDWINVAQDRDNLLAVVKMVVNLQALNCEEFLQ